MAINSGVPNQSGLASPFVFTAVAPGGTPPPASQPGSALKVYTPGQASAPGGDLQQAGPTTETLGAAGITVPVEQVVGELNDVADEANETTADVLGTVSAGAPTAGVPATPAPTVKEFSGAASTGQQPVVTTPFTGTGWATKSVV